MTRKKKTEPVDKVQEESQQKAPKKHDYLIAVTEDEYEAHREEIDKLDNVIFFVDDADRVEPVLGFVRLLFSRAQPFSGADHQRQRLRNEAF